MMSEPVSFGFIFGTILLIFVGIGIGVVLVNKRTKKLKEKK